MIKFSICFLWILCPSPCRKSRRPRIIDFHSLLFPFILAVLCTPFWNAPFLSSTTLSNAFTRPWLKVKFLTVHASSNTLNLLPNLTITFVSLDYEVVPNYFAKALMKLPMLYDEDYVENGKKETTNADESELDLPYKKYPELVMP